MIGIVYNTVQVLTLNKTAQLSRRGLSTATQSSTPSLLAGLQHTGVRRELAETIQSQVDVGVQGEYAGILLHRHLVTLMAPALPVTPPLFLPLSSLLRPGPEATAEEKFVELNPQIFSHPIRRDILHLCVTHHLDGLRQGTASTKTRGEVRGSGRKIRPQKHTGRARLGDGQSPMLRGGGVAFGPKPRDFSTKLPRKVIQMGMRAALSARVKERALGVVESLEWQIPKTQELEARLEELGWGKTLFVTGLDEIPSGLARASGNLRMVETITAEELSVYDAVKWPRLVLDVAAVDWLEQTLSKSESS